MSSAPQNPPGDETGAAAGARSDPALDAYLEARDGAPASERLGDLLDGIAAPLIWKVIRRQLGGRSGGISAEDLEDLHAATLLRLQLQLTGLRAGEREAVASFANYVAVTAFNAVSAFLMAREPERSRLRLRVRYVLRKQARLALWSGAGHESHCGLEELRGRPPVDGGFEALAAAAVAELGRQPARFGAVVARVLDRIGGPCRFEDLVDALAAALDVRDEEAASLPETVLDERPSVDSGLEARELLARLWLEIRELPAGQRVALLLNLRDDAGGEMLSGLIAAGVAPPAEVALALGLDEEALGRLLPELPLEDLRIAERLGLSRQQVINLRKSGRLRLERRMRPFFGGMA
jgi:hypothetical protein